MPLNYEGPEVKEIQEKNAKDLAEKILSLLFLLQGEEIRALTAENYQFIKSDLLKLKEELKQDAS